MDRIICLMSKGNQCCSGQAALFIAEYIRVEVVDYIRCNESEAEGNRPSDQNADRARAAGIRGVPVWAPVVAWKCKNGFYDKFESNGMCCLLHYYTLTNFSCGLLKPCEQHLTLNCYYFLA